MSLTWLAKPEVRESTKPVDTYYRDVGMAKRYQRLAVFMTQIAPGELSRSFTSPGLQEVDQTLCYRLHGIGQGVMDLVLCRANHETREILARVSLMPGAMDAVIPTTQEQQAAAARIAKFEAGEVVQPEPESGAELIVYPRFRAIPPKVKLYRPTPRISYRSHRLVGSGYALDVLVPNLMSPDDMPLANHDEMLLVLGEIEQLYNEGAHHTLEALEAEFPQVSFVRIKDNWGDILRHTDSRCQVGGGQDNNNLAKLLRQKLEERGAAGAVYVEEAHGYLRRFSIVSS